MSEHPIRVMVGEGRSARKDLLRFVLENEGYDVVAEASSTLELAQKVVVHRPDVVVLDDGIDASAVGMLREVLPSAKVILVWPRGVTAVGADARLEPDEVMTSLGATIARVMGRGSVIAPPRPRIGPPGVIVVPEPEEPKGPGEPEPPATDVAGEPEPAEDVRTSALEAAPAVAASGTLSGVLMQPPSLEAPRWTYTAPAAARADERRR